MDPESIEDPVEFCASLGNLHDARIASASVDVDEQVLYLIIDDLYANMEGRADYPGERPCALVFLNAGNVKLDVDMSDGLRIGELRVVENAGSAHPFTLEVDLNIGAVSGRSKSITAGFSALEIEDVED